MEEFTFDSRNLSKSDGFEAYHALYGFGTDVARVKGDFQAVVCARRYAQLFIFDRSLSGLSHERTRQRVVSDGFDHVTLQLVLSGRLGVTIGDERKWVGAGEMVAFDMRRPQQTWTDGVRQITVSAARDLLGKALPAAADFHGRVFAGAAVQMVRDDISLLSNRDGILEPAMAEAVASSLGPVLAAMLAAGAARLRGIAAAEIRLSQAVRFIQANLGHVELSAEMIADRIGVSRSVLYRMFEADGGVARSIKRARLLAMREALSAPGEISSIARLAKACGFNSDAHANRSFCEEFGITPGRFRTESRAVRTASGFSHWFEDFA